MNEPNANRGTSEMNATVNDSGQTTTAHRFELAGLGKAPFRFTGNVTENVFTVPGGDSKPGGCCDYCSTGIRYEFWVRSADGREFKVGCNCIHKTGDRGLIQQISAAERKLRDVKNAAAKQRKQERERVRLEAAKAKLPTIIGTLASQPHPTPYRAEQGETMLNYVRWLLANTNGQTAAGIIERTD